MKSEEKLLREMGISSWTLKKNFLLIDYLSANKIEIDSLNFLKTMSTKEKKEFLINIEKN